MAPKAQSFRLHPCGQPCEIACRYTADFCHTQKLESIGLMVGEVAHDLNNILSIVMGNTELALEEAREQQHPQERLQDIREATRNAGALCRSLLAYAGKAAPVSVPIDLTALVANLQHILRVIVPRHARLECQVSESLPPLLGDPSHLRQILLNLVLNGVDALKGVPGTIALTIECGPVEGPESSAQNYILIRVSDTGCGMDADTLNCLFQPFFSTKSEGRGLGLTVVRTLIEGMGGDVRAESQVGEGTTFTLLFPVKKHQKETLARSSPTELGPQEWTGGGTVLLADDEPDLRVLGSAMLSRLGINVLTAMNGEEAVECFKRNADTVDLVFLDMIMPKLDGSAALRSIRALNPHVRVVIISGYSELELSGRWSAAKPDEVLLKPVTAHQLRAAAIRQLAQAQGR